MEQQEPGAIPALLFLGASGVPNWSLLRGRNRKCRSFDSVAAATSLRMTGHWYTRIYPLGTKVTCAEVA